MRAGRIFVAATVVAGVMAVGDAPAGAAVTVSSSGTVIAASVTGSESIVFRCTGGIAVVATKTASYTPTPAVTCAALTQVTINGNGAGQVVNGSGLNAAAFSAKPKLVVALNEGADTVTETANADTLDLGGGDDELRLVRGTGTNTLLDLGNGTSDRILLTGSSGEDFLTAASTGTSATVVHGTEEPIPEFTWVVQGAEHLTMRGGAGDDYVDAGSVTSASSIGEVELYGEDGADQLIGAARPTVHDGGSGQNWFDLGPSTDLVHTVSETDTINGLTDPEADEVDDSGSLRFGGRKLLGFGNGGSDAVDRYRGATANQDVTVRVRPAPTGAALVTFSLDRFGQQALPPELEAIDVDLTEDGLEPRSVVDVVAPAQDVTVRGLASDDQLFDITVPSGTFTAAPSGGFERIDPADPAYGTVRVPSNAVTMAHGPWTNANEGFAHRVHRDLVFRFLTPSQREAVRDQLANGTKTRAQVVQGVVNSDEYRGIDVDRVFLRYLRRASDPGGRTYWIGSLRSGKSLRIFRAQLFGSNEYFNKAGATNAGFVARAYEDVLGRKPDPSGQAYWTNKANSGTERGQIARQFLASAEAERAIVRDQFLRFLDRQPTANELTTWTAQLDGADGEQALIRFLAGSSAYYQRT